MDSPMDKILEDASQHPNELRQLLWGWRHLLRH